MATSPDAACSALSPSQLPPVVRLNVGGLHFTTALSTLRRCPGSRLCDLFSEPPPAASPLRSPSPSPGESGGGAGWGGHPPPLRLDEDGRVFLDRDGTHFGQVLTFLREGAVPLAPAPGLRAALEVHAEARFWGLEAMARALEEAPPLFGEMVARRQFCAQVPGYRENIEIMIRVARAEALASRLSRVLVHVNKSSEHEVHHHNHHNHHEGSARRAHACSIHGEQYLVNFGPWSVEPGVRDLLDCVKVDVEALGYRVTWEERLPPPGEGGGDRGAGLAGLFRGPPAPPPSCGLYEFLFHWW
ncbi:BTB/POZ domain-containing protein KCTD14-like [Lethenteron reissneri]|uniref:BTB/POZ domain-containing protein KCTD14-like n=1 Tax=Lethenteron reissneri TaxID=7753 RepID=UPI002AB78DF0|nr:BTB/POZ domain-containing protein KCTD14-like [Lethenteron reissneri]